MVRAQLYLKGKLHHATGKSSVLLAHIGLTNLPFPIEQSAIYKLVSTNHVIMKTIILRVKYIQVNKNILYEKVGGI